MISLGDLRAALPAPLALYFVDGSVLVVKIIALDEADDFEIGYEVIEVLRSPGYPVDAPGQRVCIPAAAVASWRVYEGPETKPAD